MANIFTRFYDYLNARLDASIEDLKKSDQEDLQKGQRADGTFGRKGLLFDPFTDQSVGGGLFKPKSSFLSNHILKQVSRRDPIVASIIDVRSAQVATACKRPENRFELGFKIVPKDKTISVDLDEVREIEEFILNTGYSEDRPPEDKMTFAEWGYAITRDWNVYGHCAIEKVKRNDGKLHSFLPIAAETVYYANRQIDKKLIDGMRNTWRQTIDPNKVDVSKVEKGDYEFIQVVDGKVVEGWAADELIFAKLNVETDIELKGYAVGPLERAIGAILGNLQIDNHNRQFFTHGMASKGLLVVQGDVTPNALRALQTQWNNQVTGPINAWRTPILAGIKGVQWVPLTATNRDMEYAAYQDQVLRKIFSCFAMDPEEAGFGYLSKGQEQRTLSESSNEWKITASRDRGLRPILTRIEGMINEDILPEMNEEYAKKYHFQFVGLDAETKMEELERLEHETSLLTTLDEARKQTDRDPMDIGGGLILNPLLIQILTTNLPKGLFMEKFLGVKGASQRPDLQYVPDPLWFQFQTLLMQLSGMMGGFGGPQPRDPKGHFAGTNAPGTKDEGGGEKSEAEANAEEEAMMQAQMEATERYIAANPDVFKSIQANFERHEFLRKSGAMHDPKIDEDADRFVKQYRKAAEELVKEIVEAVQEEVAEAKSE
jgi:hypothetical protein